jgi:RimJ/RimL family protein N-acetyltransferase
MFKFKNRKSGSNSYMIFNKNEYYLFIFCIYQYFNLINSKKMEFRRIVNLDMREMDEVALEKSWEWLNDPEIKRLTITPDFSKDEQKKWFESIKNRKDYWITVGWHNGEPIVIGGLKNIGEKDAEIFGYIGNKEYWGKGVAVDVMNMIHEYARSLGLESIYSKMLKENRNSIRLHNRFGYKYEKDIEGERIMMRLAL